MAGRTSARGSLIVAAITIGACAAVASIVAAAVMYAGVYNVAATEQHLAPTFRALDVGLRRSVEYHARKIPVPALNVAATIEHGLACFKLHCEQCHGGPGIARAAFARGLLPVPSSLSQASRDWEPAELYWITRHGIKMTGMPAWEYRLDDDALWSIVAFLQTLPLLTPDTYLSRTAALQTQACDAPPARGGEGDGDWVRGRIAIQQYACTACHRIPGIVGPASHTGPPLTSMGARRYIGGVLPNTPENMGRWLREPQKVNPGTAMPDLGLTEADSRDIAAYLARLQ